MTSDIMKTCADMLFTDAVSDLAAREGRPTDLVRRELVESGAYAALYDFETDLWQCGPEYLIDFHHSLQTG